MNDETLFDDALAARRAISRVRDMPPPSIRSDADAEFAAGMIAASMRDPAPPQHPAGQSAEDAQKLLAKTLDAVRPLLIERGYNTKAST